MNNLETFLMNNNISPDKVKFHSFENSTHTAEEAAQRLSCGLNQIVKSLIIMVKTAEEEDFPMLVLVPGPKRLRQRLIRKVLKDQLNIQALDSRLATQDEVLELTGYQVGGVPPISLNMQSLMDSDLENESVLYGGGGTATTIIEIPTNLVKKLSKPVIGSIC